MELMMKEETKLDLEGAQPARSRTEETSKLKHPTATLSNYECEIS